MSNVQKFQHIIRGIREDLTFIENLYEKLHWNLMHNPVLRTIFSYEKLASEIKEWINDVFLDKVYEVDSKTLKFLADVSLKEATDKMLSTQEIEKYIRDILQNDKGLVHEKTYLYLESLEKAIKNYRDAFNRTMDYVRKYMYKTNWVRMKEINIEDYIFQQRRKYILAREELEKARQAFKARQTEEVFNHLRPASEFAIKERFGFSKIHPMKQFLDSSKELNLPSYDMLYFIFDEGSGRLHEGKIHTSLECQTALEFVARFIDQLDLIDISKEKIEEFKQKCKFVK